MDENYNIYERWRVRSDRLDYSLITLGFASMGLSFQFSPSFGKEWPWVLIVSWCFYFISAVFGGVRLIKTVTFSRIEYQKYLLEEDVLNKEKYINYRASFDDKITDKYILEEGLNSDLQIQYEDLNKAKSLLLESSKYMSVFFMINFIILILGFILNGIFIAKNFLDKI